MNSITMLNLYEILDDKYEENVITVKMSGGGAALMNAGDVLDHLESEEELDFYLQAEIDEDEKNEYIVESGAPAGEYLIFERSPGRKGKFGMILIPV